MDLMAIWAQMGYVAKAVAFVLFIMSMWSFGVAIERIFTFTQARNQSKMYAPQDRKSTRLNSSHSDRSRMPSSA